MAVPEHIRALKPKEFGCVEIREMKGRYYVYKVSSKWNREKGRAQKVTGGCVGKIIEGQGFVPNHKGDRESAPLYPKVLNYGAYAIAGQCSGDLEDRMARFFPHVWREMAITAKLRLVDMFESRESFARALSSSYLNEIHPDIGPSEETIATLVRRLGPLSGEMDDFMKSYMGRDAKILIDATSIFTQCSDSVSRSGYNPVRRKGGQVRLLYLFDQGKQTPVFFRMSPGDIVDKNAVEEMLRIPSLSKCLVIGDKGFYSRKNLSVIMETGNDFILPLQANTKMIPESFDNEKDERVKYDGRFDFKDRIIRYKKVRSGSNGNYIYIFCDEARRMAAEVRQCKIERIRRDEGAGDETETQLSETDESSKRPGIFAFASNLDKDAEDVYLLYKQRWDIEQAFDYLKDSIDVDSPYMRSNEDLAAWSFLNHITLLYFYGILKALRDAELNDTTSVADVLAIGRNIYKVKAAYYDNEFRVSEIARKDKELLAKIGVDLFRKMS